MAGKFFETSDICLASTLSIRGCRVVNTREVGNGKVVFLFEKNKDSECVRGDYECQIARVEPTKFLAEYRRLKTLALSHQSGTSEIPRFPTKRLNIIY